MNVTCDGQPTDLEISRADEFALCQEAQFNEDGPNVNIVAFVSPEPGAVPVPTALAVTIVWFFDDGEIIDADMLINEDLAPHTVCPDEGCVATPGTAAAVDLQNIVTHEVGHFLGIAHTNVEEATMFCESPRGEVSKRTLAEDDIAGLCAIYPPGSIGGGCDPTPRGGTLTADCTGPLPSNGGGCSAHTGTDPGSLWTLWAAFLVLIVLRLRQRQSLRDRVR